MIDDIQRMAGRSRVTATDEVIRLREVIRNAPHDPTCQVNVNDEALCDCFKSEAYPRVVDSQTAEERH